MGEDESVRLEVDTCFFNSDHILFCIHLGVLLGVVVGVAWKYSMYVTPLHRDTFQILIVMKKFSFSFLFYLFLSVFI